MSNDIILRTYELSFVVSGRVEDHATESKAVVEGTLSVQAADEEDVWLVAGPLSWGVATGDLSAAEGELPAHMRIGAAAIIDEFTPLDHVDESACGVRLLEDAPVEVLEGAEE